MSDDPNPQDKQEDIENKTSEESPTAETKESHRQKRNVMKEEIEGAQAYIDVGEETKEKLQENKIKTFFEGVFGEDNAVSGFLTSVTSWIATKVGVEYLNEMPYDEFCDEIDKQKEEAGKKSFDPEEFIFWHRCLGAGRGENTKESLEACLNNEHGKPEIDLRRGKDGEIYLAHDPLRNSKTSLDKLFKFSDALKLIAEHPNQDATMIFDVKENHSLMNDVDKMIQEIDEQNKHREDYNPISERHFILSFNEEICKNAQENTSEKRPVMFSYIPTCKLQLTETIVETMGESKLMKICESVDDLAGTNYKEALKNISVKVEGKDIPGTDKLKDEVLHIYNELPPDEILENITHICVPAALATKEIVDMAHKKGIKVAVWGAHAEGTNLQRMIAVIGADLIISDKPDIIEETS